MGARLTVLSPLAGPLTGCWGGFGRLLAFAAEQGVSNPRATRLRTRRHNREAGPVRSAECSGRTVGCVCVWPSRSRNEAGNRMRPGPEERNAEGAGGQSRFGEQQAAAPRCSGSFPRAGVR